MKSNAACRVSIVVLSMLLMLAFIVSADDTLMLEGDSLAQVLPTTFYFEGRTGPTQVRNAAAVRFGAKHHVIVALVDTAGYSSDIRAKYEGFFITDAKISIGGQDLAAGAYGFGVAKDNKFNLFDVGGNLLLSATGARDAQTRTPRPLSMLKDNGGVRLYRGRSYVVVMPK